MSRKDEAFLRRLTQRLAELGITQARPHVMRASDQLGRALRIVRDTPNRIRLYIPHYWAVYVHDGRGPFGPRTSQNLIWFRDPKQDPRLINGKTPERAYKLRHLTRLAFIKAKEMNRQHLRNGGSVDTLPVIIVKRVDTPTAPQPFFLNEPPGGMRDFPSRAGNEARDMALNHIRSRHGVKPKLEKSVARGRIG